MALSVIDRSCNTNMENNFRSIQFKIDLLAGIVFLLALASPSFGVQPPTRPSPTPTPVYRPRTPIPVYQPKTAPSPTGAPTIKPPVYTAAGPKAPQLTNESFVGTWIGTATLTDGPPTPNGFRFTNKIGELTGVWLNGKEEKPIQSKDIVITGTMFSIKITEPDYAITFAGYFAGGTGEIKGTLLIDSLGEKTKGTWTASRKTENTAASPKELVDRGQILIGKKDYDGALKAFSQAIDAKPDYIEAYRFRAITALLIYESNPPMHGQKLYTAVFNFDHAINRGSTNPDDFYLRGQTHEKLNDKAKAIADYRSALKYYSGHQKAREAMARLGVKP